MSSLHLASKKGLLKKDISARFAGEGEVASRKFRMVNSSPGVIYLLAGLAIDFRQGGTRTSLREEMASVRAVRSSK